MCVHYLGDFDENITNFSVTKPKSLKILPHKQKFRKGKKPHSSVSICCAESQNSHCDLRENIIRQLHFMLQRFKHYQVQDYLIPLASAFPPAKRITELHRQKQYCF